VIRWQRGEADIERLLGAGSLQRVHGAEARGGPWLERAARTVAAADAVIDTDPASACTLAYDAARFACTALLAQQGLRPTTAGGHLVVEEAVRAQFGDAFKPFRDLRIRRNELEYPTFPDEEVAVEEARESVDAARGLIDAAQRLATHLRIF
jgi:HEPN domain-containing protein